MEFEQAQEIQRQLVNDNNLDMLVETLTLARDTINNIVASI